MSKISNLVSGTSIKDSFIFLAVSNSKNLKVPSYKLINFLNKNLEISKTRPFLSPSDFSENKFLLTSKTNRLYVTDISPSQISYDTSKETSFEQKYNNLNSKLNGDYVEYRDKILTYINSKESTENEVNTTLNSTIIKASALSGTYNATVSSNSDSIAVFTNGKLTNLNLNTTEHKGYYIAKHVSSILDNIEKIGNISSTINEDMIEIQKAGTIKLYEEQSILYPWNFGTEDARELPSEHIKHILDTIKTKVTGLSYTSANIDKWLENEGSEELPEGAYTLNLEDVVSDIRYKIATTNSTFITNGYKFYKIYDLYSAGQELYYVMDNILKCTIDPDRPKWEKEYTQYLDYKTYGSSAAWGKVTTTANLLNKSINYVNYTDIFGNKK